MGSTESDGTDKDLHHRRPSSAKNQSLSSTNSGNCGPTNMLDLDPPSAQDGKLKVASTGAITFPVQEVWNILLLLVLYTLQGIPMGLSASLPLILKEKGALNTQV